MHCLDGLPSSRRGASFLEFVGYMSAMVGGIVLGSMYLGVDVKLAALSVLSQAQIIAPPAQAEVANADKPVEGGSVESAMLATTPNPSIPSESDGPAPQARDSASRGSASDVEITSAADDDGSADEPVVKKEDVPATASDASAPEPTTAAPEVEDLINLTDEQRQALTVAYWTALDRCMNDEVENRIAGIRDSGNLQLFDYLSCRAEGHQAALEAINKLSTRGVDAHVAAYAGKARQWHADGAKLFARALDLLTDAPTAQLSGPFAQSWQSAATQHRMEERLLSEKHRAVRSYLDHSKQLEPAAERPATSAETAQ